MYRLLLSTMGVASGIWICYGIQLEWTLDSATCVNPAVSATGGSGSSEVDMSMFPRVSHMLPVTAAESVLVFMATAVMIVVAFERILRHQMSARSLTGVSGHWIGFVLFGALTGVIVAIELPVDVSIERCAWMTSVACVAVGLMGLLIACAQQWTATKRVARLLFAPGGWTIPTLVSAVCVVYTICSAASQDEIWWAGIVMTMLCWIVLELTEKRFVIWFANIWWRSHLEERRRLHLANLIWSAAGHLADQHCIAAGRMDGPVRQTRDEVEDLLHDHPEILEMEEDDDKNYDKKLKNRMMNDLSVETLETVAKEAWSKRALDHVDKQAIDAAIPALDHVPSSWQNWFFWKIPHDDGEAAPYLHVLRELENEQITAVITSEEFQEQEKMVKGHVVQATSDLQSRIGQQFALVRDHIATIEGGVKDQSKVLNKKMDDGFERVNKIAGLHKQEPEPD